nr:MAG TPA: hypothetical protein [Caudoviricetes sp.]
MTLLLLHQLMDKHLYMIQLLHNGRMELLLEVAIFL